MNAEVSILGVCRLCQGAHPVFSNPDPDPDSPQNVDEASLYYMASHRTDAYGKDTGPWCNGIGTVPNAIVRR